MVNNYLIFAACPFNFSQYFINLRWKNVCTFYLNHVVCASNQCINPWVFQTTSTFTWHKSCEIMSTIPYKGSPFFSERSNNQLTNFTIRHLFTRVLINNFKIQKIIPVMPVSYTHL